MIKVLIADDQELIRQSLQIVLNSRPDIMVTDVASNGQEVIRSVRKNKPDVILMDIRMPKLDGVQCTKIIKENYPQIKIIILTTFDDDEYVYNALKYGASGYLLKGVSMDELANAITTVYNGWAMINPDIATKVLRLFSQMAQADYSILVGDKNVDELTKTEWKIIAQVEMGASNITVHTLALKKGSRILTEGLSIPDGAAVQAMLDYAAPALRSAGFAPYYLYRQKYMSGSFENVGWCRPGGECWYNVDIMSELCSILSFGAGGSTKMVEPGTNHIERVFNVKYPKEYTERPEKVLANQAAFAEFYQKYVPET